jgi:1,2-dihydroxy-3-keto-5-methylthiopentene dioxygenase
MSRLAIFEIDAPNQAAEPIPSLETTDANLIATELGERGIVFERWPAPLALAPDASNAAILLAYDDAVKRVQASGNYPTVDAIRMTPDHPERATLRQRFLAEHIHTEDEVRFFVEGQGLFCLHIGNEVLQVLCERNDFLRVPAGTRHWFDMGSAPTFTAIRFFDNPDGWVAQFSGDPIAGRYPLLP